MEKLDAEIQAYHKVTNEVKLSKLSTRMGQVAKWVQRSVDAKVFRLWQIVAWVIIAQQW
jgi:hypothetical protein